MGIDVFEEEAGAFGRRMYVSKESGKSPVDSSAVYGFNDGCANTTGTRRGKNSRGEATVNCSLVRIPAAFLIEGC
jgi:hypothetical protein